MRPALVQPGGEAASLCGYRKEQEQSITGGRPGGKRDKDENVQREAHTECRGQQRGLHLPEHRAVGMGQLTANQRGQRGRKCNGGRCEVTDVAVRGPRGRHGEVRGAPGNSAVGVNITHQREGLTSDWSGCRKTLWEVSVGIARRILLSTAGSVLGYWGAARGPKGHPQEHLSAVGVVGGAGRALRGRLQGRPWPEPGGTAAGVRSGSLRAGLQGGGLQRSSSDP